MAGAQDDAALRAARPRTAAVSRKVFADAIDALLARHGLCAARTALVSRLDCEIHRIALARPHGRPGLPADADLALRIYPAERNDPQPIDAEMTWLSALSEEGLHTPRPLRDAEGTMRFAWQPDPSQAARHAVLLTWLPGRQLDHGLKPCHLERVGELTARMHLVAERLRSGGQLGCTRLADQPRLAAWARGDFARFPSLPGSTHEVLVRAAQRLQAELAGLGERPDAFGWIHGDLHAWNLLFHGRAAGAIDFSECGFGHHAQDLACTLQYLRHPWVGNHDHSRAYPALRDGLLAGYARQRALPQDVERQIDLHIAVRMINTVEWILNCWQRVDWRPWGPAFLARVGSALEDWKD